MVDAHLLYSYYAANGVKLSEATVFSSLRAQGMTLPVDQRDGAELALAIANDTDQSVTYNVSESFHNDSRYDDRGSLQPGEYLPRFPQFADGVFAEGASYRTTRILVNSDLNVPTDCTTLLRGMTTDGTSFFPGRLAARATAVSNPTRGVQAFQSEYATTQCDSAAVFGELLYSYFDADGVKLSEATVFSSPPAQRVQILADQRGGSRVGLAIANDSDQTNTYIHD